MHKYAFAQAMLAVAAMFAVVTIAQAQVSLTGTGAANQYTQNFDSLVSAGTNNAWTNNSTIPGWYSTRTPTTQALAAPLPARCTALASPAPVRFLIEPSAGLDQAARARFTGRFNL